MEAVYERLKGIAFRKGIDVEEAPFSLEVKGFVWTPKSGTVVAVNSRLPSREKALTLAHELGHYFLGHLPRRHQATDETRQAFEDEAEAFGRRLVQLLDGVD